MKTNLGIKLAAITAALSLIAQPLLLGAEKMQCTVQNGHVMSMEGKPMGMCVMMQNGKMMMTDKKGKLVPMKKDMTMPDGTKCMVNGTCVMKSGQKMKMTEGEVMDSSSKVFRIRGVSLGQKG